MSLTNIDILLMACMYGEDRIGKHHGNVDRILKICTPKEYRDRWPLGILKKRMRKLAAAGYLIRKRGKHEAYSLDRRGVRVAERWKKGWTAEEIIKAEPETD